MFWGGYDMMSSYCNDVITSSLSLCCNRNVIIHRTVIYCIAEGVTKIESTILDSYYVATYEYALLHESVLYASDI